METKFLENPEILSRGVYFQMVVKLKFLDDAIIRSNEPDEVLTFNYTELGNRFIIPWRKVKGKLRRMVMEKQREMGIVGEFVAKTGPFKEKKRFCHLKDDLCMRCPSCFLFGGAGKTSSVNVDYNILARVLGETFISEKEIEEIQPYTANAIDEKTLSTGRDETGALFTLIKVPAETEFIGVITLRDPTQKMASILVDNIKRLSRLGARSVEWGRVKTEIKGYKIADRENISAYALAGGEKLELDDLNALKLPDVNDSYKTLDKQVKQLIDTLG